MLCRDTSGWLLGALALSVGVWATGCDDSPAPSSDAAAPADLGVEADLPPPPEDVPHDGGPGPYDAGSPPVCGLAPRFAPLAARAPGYTTVEPGAIAPYRMGFVVAWRESAPRIPLGDAAPPQRDAVVVAAVGTDGTTLRSRSAVVESASEGTDLGTPEAVPFGAEGAAVIFGDTLGLPGESRFRTRIRAFPVDRDGAPGDAVLVADDHGSPFAAALPGGVPMVLASRVLETLDGGVVIARPVSFRLSPSLVRDPPLGRDLTGTVPLEAESVQFGAAPDGAALVYRAGDQVRVTRFDRDGVVNPRVAITREVNPPRIEAAAATDEAAVLAWTDTVNGMSTVTAAVVGDDNRLRLRQELDRFVGPTRVAAAAAHGGVALVWTRGTAEAATLRGVVVQPNGIVRGAPRDLVSVPGAEGRVVVQVTGRSLRFALRARGADGVSLGFGQVCLPE